MAFEIKDKAGNAIPINTLDEEVAKFWGKEVRKKDYASPYDYPDKSSIENIDQLRMAMAFNWFDIIGFNIHCLKKKGQVSWNLVIAEIMDAFDIDLHNFPSLVKSNHDYANFMQHYLDLIKHWDEKGYEAYCIIDE